MKKQLILKIFFTFIILTLVSCSDPIFKTISQEEKQLEPHVKGSPTNFVEFNSKMYVASGTTLYRYDGTKSGKPSEGNWYDIPNVGKNGIIRQLAVTNNVMYVLCGESGQNVLRKSSNGTSWSDVHVNDDILVQSVYGVNNQLFIGAGTNNVYSIYKYDGSNFEFLIATENRLLNGAASNGTSYFLIAKDLGSNTGSTYSYDGINTNSITNLGNTSFMGIISLGSQIVAISRNGFLFYITTNILQTGHKLNSSSSNLFATGALAIWTAPHTSNKLLLAGRQDGMNFSVNYLQGYQELELDSSGNIISGASFRDPGINPSLSTVNDNASYKTNMEKNPVNHLHQAGDGILFAATQAKGVWSYRQRGDRWLWNAEQ